MLTINVSEPWRQRLVARLGDLIAVRDMRPEDLSMINPKDLLLLRAVVCQGSLAALQPALMELHAGWRFRHAPAYYIGDLNDDRERFLADALTIRSVHDEAEFANILDDFVQDIRQRALNQPLVARLEAKLAQQLSDLQVSSARRTIEAMAAFDTHYRRWLMYVAIACDKLRDYVQAEAVFSELARLFPFMLHAHIGAANMLVRRRAYAAAYKIYGDIEAKCGDLIGTLLSMGQAGERHAMVAPLSSLAQLSEQLFGENFAMAYYQGYAEALLRTRGQGLMPASAFIASLEDVSAPRFPRHPRHKAVVDNVPLRPKSDDQLGFDVFAGQFDLTKDLSTLAVDKRLPLQLGTVLNTVYTTMVPEAAADTGYSADRTLIYHPNPDDAKGFKRLLSDGPNHAVIVNHEHEVISALRSYPITTFVGWYVSPESRLPEILEDILSARDLGRIATLILCPGEQALHQFRRVSKHLLYDVLTRVDRTRRGFDFQLQRAHEMSRRTDSQRGLLEQLRHLNRAVQQETSVVDEEAAVRLLDGVDLSGPADCWLQLERCQSLLLQQKYHDVVTGTARIMQLWPELWDTWNLNAYARHKIERHHRATKELVERTMQQPMLSVERCYQVARVLIVTQDIATLHAFLQFWRHHVDVVKDHRYWFVLAHYSRLVGELKTSQQHFLRAVHDTPLNWEYVRALAQVLEADKRYGDAVKVWEYAAKLWRADNLAAELGRVRCLLAMQATDSARPIVEALLIRYPHLQAVQRLAQQMRMNKYAS